MHKVLYVLAGIAFYVLIAYLLSLFAWRKLSSHYPFRPPLPHLTRIGLISLRLNDLVAYNNVILLYACPEGFLLKPVFVLRPFFHPPVFIPWEAITRKTDASFVQKLVQISIGKGPVSQLTLSRKTYVRLMKHEVNSAKIN